MPKNHSRVCTIPMRVASHKRQRIELAGGGVTLTSVPNGHTLADVELWVDVTALAKSHGIRAIGSKGKKCRLAGGAIILRAVNVRKADA